MRDYRTLDIENRARETMADPLAICSAGPGADLADWIEAIATVHLQDVAWHVERPEGQEPYLVIDEA